MIFQDPASFTHEAHPPTLLIVDDDARIRSLLKTFLRSQGFLVFTASDAQEAQCLLKSLVFDLLILDVMMPGLSGVDFIEKLRHEQNPVLVLMLSALGERDHRICGLTAGCDDYLSKPFAPQELLLRIKALLRRGGQKKEPNLLAPCIEFGLFRFYIERGELRRGADLIQLSSRERECLRILATKAGKVVSRNELAVFGSQEGARGVDVQINRLRRKIEENPAEPLHLQTVRGEGYVLIPQNGHDTGFQEDLC